jgi:hypothetical protein
LRPAQENSSGDPISKCPAHKKMSGRVTQVVECLPNKGEALSSNPSTGGKKVKKVNPLFFFPFCLSSVTSMASILPFFSN